MAQDILTSAGLDCCEGQAPHCSEIEALSQGDKEYDDILELNQFDGLPYSSRFYKLLRERKELPVWEAKCDFMDTLGKEQFVNVSGCARTGRSSQVSTVWRLSLLGRGNYCTFHSCIRHEHGDRKVLKSSQYKHIAGKIFDINNLLLF